MKDNQVFDTKNNQKEIKQLFIDKVLRNDWMILEMAITEDEYTTTVRVILHVEPITS